jgi:hypothetical protein
MSGHPDRIAEHYRKLAAEEVALAKAAVTNEARAKHYAMAAEYWRLAQTAEDDPSLVQSWPRDALALPALDTRGRGPFGRQGIVPLLGGLIIRLGTHTQHSHSQITNSALHVLRVVFYRVGSGKGKQMIAAPIEPKASKVAQALAIAFIVFLVVLSVWELFAIRF